MGIPGFAAGASLNIKTLDYQAMMTAACRTNSKEVVPEFRCWAYGLLCVLQTEDPILAGWCWYGFARACGGGMA
jgi:hypothetical protein